MENGNGDTPRRRHDDTPDYISPAELPRYNFREIKRLWRRIDEQIRPELKALQRALFGFQDEALGSWTNGLIQNLSEMREAQALAAAEMIKSRATQRKIFWALVVLTGVIALNGAHPGWGDTIAKLLPLVK